MNVGRGRFYSPRSLLARIVHLARRHPTVEGLLVHGSMATSSEDPYSDIDLVVVTNGTAQALEGVRKLVDSITRDIGAPLARNERRWGPFRMTELLYGIRTLPPVGTSIDLTFSPLTRLTSLTGLHPFEVVFDRTGRLRSTLNRDSGSGRIGSSTRLIDGEPVKLFPFYYYEARKALIRKDVTGWHGYLEELRRSIFWIAGMRTGVESPGRPKRALRLLGRDSRAAVLDSYGSLTGKTLEGLGRAYLAELGRIEGNANAQNDVDLLQRTLAELS